MWIRTQDKEQLLQVRNFSLTRNFGGSKKFAILGIIDTIGLFSNQKILGLYTTKPEAIQELDKIQKYLESSNEETYQMN